MSAVISPCGLYRYRLDRIIYAPAGFKIRSHTETAANDYPQSSVVSSEKDSMDRPKEFLAWAVEIFGPVALEREERLLRFMEEAVELAHAAGLPEIAINRLIEHVYSRKRGVVKSEVGQAQACLETFAESIGLSSQGEAQAEFDRVRSIPKEEWARRYAAKVKIGIAH